MEISLEELLQNGKALTIKNKNYFETKAYVEPFLDRVSKYTNDFTCQVKLPDTMTKTDDVLNQGFTRVWVQGILPDEYSYNNHRQSINLLYALDTRKPIVKMFKNTVNMACLNMCVFDPDHLQVTNLEPETALNYRFIKEVMEFEDNTNRMLKMYADTYLTNDEVFNALGSWIDRCIQLVYDNGYNKVKLAESVPVEVYKSVFLDEDSEYFCPEETSYFNIYNAFTDIITHDKGKDIVNKFEKTYLVSKILGL